MKALITLILFIATLQSSPQESNYFTAQGVPPTLKIVRNATDTTITKNEYTLTISATNMIASLQIPQEQYDNWNKSDSGFNNTAQRNELTKVLYSFFKDDFDFIFFINNEQEKPSTLSYYGQLVQIKNSIEGLGLSPFDYTATTGSAGKLQSVIHLPYLKAIMNGPTLHELMHNWANFMKSFEMASPTGNYPSKPHWGWASTEGQLGGFKKSTLKDLGGGLYQANNGRPGATSFGGFANGGNGLPYGPWEMYLAGFWPLDSAEDIVYFEGITTDATLYAEGKFNATSKKTYTKTQMLADNGERIPSADNSQKSFRVLPVVLTPRPLVDSEWNTVTEQVSWFMTDGIDNSTLFNFYEATRGIATISSDTLKKSLLQPTPLTNSVTVPSKEITIQQNNRTINLSQPVEGYRITRSNGAIIQEKSGAHISTILLDHNLSKGIYLLTFRINGQWQTSRSIRMP